MPKEKTLLIGSIAFVVMVVLEWPARHSESTAEVWEETLDQARHVGFDYSRAYESAKKAD
jgi:hypothetical protein